MPATPAWPPRSTPRLFVADALAPGERTIEGAAAHYLGTVMRVPVGGAVRLCDDATGEWLSIVRESGRRTVRVEVTERLAPREPVPDLWLCFAPLKKGPIDFLAEKACELGVARLVPVVTRRTVVETPKLERLRATMIEAAEQCGRTALPELGETTKLAALLRDWCPTRALFFADELGAPPAAAAMRAHAGPAAILIGPEGGFDDVERAAIRATPGALPIGLGPRILRAETAAAAAVSIWMAVAGDWGAGDWPMASPRNRA